MIYNDLYLCRKFLRFLHFLHRILKVGEFATNSAVFDERIVVLDQLFCSKFAKTLGIFQNGCYICAKIDKIRGINGKQ